MLTRYIALIIFMTMMLVAVTSFGYEVPKDAVIKVYTKDGKQIGHMSRAEYKVVKIDHELEKRTVRVDKRSATSVIIHAGAGKSGFDVNRSGGVFRVSEKNSLVGGATICRGHGIGACFSAFTNKTFTLGLKLDF